MLAIQKVTHGPSGGKRDNHVHSKTQRNLLYYSMNKTTLYTWEYVVLQINKRSTQPEYRLRGPQSLQLLLGLQLCNVHHLWALPPGTARCPLCHVNRCCKLHGHPDRMLHPQTHWVIVFTAWAHHCTAVTQTEEKHGALTSWLKQTASFF